MIINRLQVFAKYRYLLFNLIRRDLTVKYRRSFLGVWWSVLNPFLMMLVITMVFENIFKTNIEFFPVYYLSGALVFNFVVEATNLSLNSIISNASLIKKVYIPKYIFPLEKCIFAMINALFSLIALIPVMIVLNVPVSPVMMLFPIPLIYTLIFCVGFGMILACANVFFRDTGHLYSVWVAAWMYLTPIIYPVELISSMPAAVQTAVRFNPLFYFVGYFRKVVLFAEIPSFWDNLACFSISAAALLAGIVVFKMGQDKFILHI